MTQDKTGPDATPRIGLDLGRQNIDDPTGSDHQEEPAGTSEERIRRKAYEIWEREGRTGDAQDHWHRAERELSEATQAPSEGTVENAPPAAAVGALEAAGNEPTETTANQKKAPRRRIL
jgi:hypothetical protein